MKAHYYSLFGYDLIIEFNTEQPIKTLTIKGPYHDAEIRFSKYTIFIGRK